MNRAPIEIDTFHHVYNRGTDKRLIFMDDADRKLFLKYLHILNDADIESPSKSIKAREKTEKAARRLVNICAFCLMSNHFHLLLHEHLEGGISKFMQRVGTAYTMYFNEKYDRSGGLFQGAFKSRLIGDESYLMRVIDYIHVNPIQHRKEDGSKKMILESDLKFLDKYTWSSYRDYCGQPTHATLLQREALDDYLEIPKNYQAWLFEQNDFTDLGNLAIDN